MTDSAETTNSEAAGAEGTQPVAADSSQPVAVDSSQPVAASSPPAWAPEPSAQQSALGAAAEHPEILVGAAFAGGLLLATILKRFAR